MHTAFWCFFLELWIDCVGLFIFIVHVCKGSTNSKTYSHCSVSSYVWECNWQGWGVTMNVWLKIVCFKWYSVYIFLDIIEVLNVMG